MCPQLISVEAKAGLIPPVGVLDLSEAGTNRDRSLVPNEAASQVDALDRGMVIFRHPAAVAVAAVATLPGAVSAEGRARDKYRRVDLIVIRVGQLGQCRGGSTSERFICRLPPSTLFLSLLGFDIACSLSPTTPHRLAVDRVDPVRARPAPTRRAPRVQVRLGRDPDARLGPAPRG